jgi:hypothetical protein
MGPCVRRDDGEAVIASEAKQSRPTRRRLDCFVASLLAMTERHTFSFSRQLFARALQFRSLPLQTEGAGKTGCAPHPRSRVQWATREIRTRADRFGGGSPAFPAQWFDGLCRALPGDRLFDTIVGGPYRQLDASSRGVRTTRFCRRQLPSHVRTRPAPTAACPHVRDVRERPSGGTGWAH